MGAEKMRLGIVGTNFVSDWLCEAAESVEGIRVSGVCSRREDTGRAFADRHGISFVTTDLDALFAQVDGVYLASPNACHKEQAERALTAGCSVLCEKPAATNRADLVCLTDLAARRGLVFMEAMRPLHDPFFACLRDNLPRIGCLRLFHFDFCQYSSRYDRFRAGEVMNAFDPTLGNGAVMDIGVYPLAIAAGLFGRPRRVEAASVFLPGGMEGAGNVLLSYDSFQGTVTYSKINVSPCESALYGEEGALFFGRPTAPDHLTFLPRGGEAVSLFASSTPNNMVFELQDFLAAVCNARKGGQTLYPAEGSKACPTEIPPGKIRAGADTDLSFFTRTSLDTAFLLDAIRDKAGITFSPADGQN